MDQLMVKKTFFTMAMVLVFMVSVVSYERQGGNADGTTMAKIPENTQENTQENMQENTEENAVQTGSDETGSIPVSVDNDTVELGTLDTFTPSDDIDANSGTAIAGSEEEQLQQERIAGGAVGGVVSENLEPLNGITDYSEGEYEPVYGVTVE